MNSNNWICSQLPVCGSKQKTITSADKEEMICSASPFFQYFLQTFYQIEPGNEKEHE